MLRAFGECLLIFVTISLFFSLLIFCDSLLTYTYYYYFVHSQMAKSAMSMLNRFDVADQYPWFYLIYYGRLAWRFEPLQVCADMLRRAFETALSLGQVGTAFYCSTHSIKSLFYSGARLRSILKEIDYYLHLLETYKSEASKNFLLIFRETVSLLIDNGKTTSIESTPCVGDLDDPGNKLRESALFHKVIQCLWVGHAQRCRYYSEKCVPILAPLAQLTTFMSKFYHGKAADVIIESIVRRIWKYIVSLQLFLFSTCIANFQD